MTDENPERAHSIVKRSIDEYVATRSQQLEKLVAAFIKEAGSEKASEFVLVEERRGNTIRWYFAREDEVPPPVTDDHLATIIAAIESLSVFEADREGGGRVFVLADGFRNATIALLKEETSDYTLHSCTLREGKIQISLGALMPILEEQKLCKPK